MHHILYNKNIRKRVHVDLGHKQIYHMLLKIVDLINHEELETRFGTYTGIQVTGAIVINLAARCWMTDCSAKRQVFGGDAMYCCGTSPQLDHSVIQMVARYHSEPGIDAFGTCFCFLVQ